VLGPVPNYVAGMTRGLHGLRVGVDHTWNTNRVDGITVDAVTAVLQTVRDLGAEIRAVTFPDVGQIITDWLPLCSVQTAVAHEATYPARKSEYGPALSSFIDPGRRLSGLDYQKIIVLIRGLKLVPTRCWRASSGALRQFPPFGLFLFRQHLEPG
jgi:amidase